MTVYIASRYVHRNKQEACTCSRLYVKNMKIDFLATLEKNLRSAPTPWQIPGYAPVLKQVNLYTHWWFKAFTIGPLNHKLDFAPVLT